jgi:hypothetical protein
VLCLWNPQCCTTQFSESLHILLRNKTPINITIKEATKDCCRSMQDVLLNASIRWKSNITVLIFKSLSTGKVITCTETEFGVAICHIGRTSDSSTNLVIYLVLGYSVHVTGNQISCHCHRLVFRYAIRSRLSSPACWNASMWSRHRSCAYFLQTVLTFYRLCFLSKRASWKTFWPVKFSTDRLGVTSRRYFSVCSAFRRYSSV